MNIAVLVSGNGSNLQALIDASAKDGLGGAALSLVVSDKPDAFALERARKAGIDCSVIEAGGKESREEYDTRLADALEGAKVELIVMAGFMRILSGKFVEKYAGKILNIHPALLPSFKGAHGIKDAFDHGVKVTGVSVHFVTGKLDDGPIILQAPIRIEADDTMETLEKKIHAEEHKLYPEAVRLFVGGKLEINGRKVRIFEGKG